MKKLYAFIGACLLFTLSAEAQVSFKKQNTKFSNTGIHSGNCVAIADWNFDGLDDVIRLDDGRTVIVEVQRTNNTFQSRRRVVDLEAKGCRVRAPVLL